MSDNLALGTLPEGVESPEALINGAFSAIDSLLTESYDIDLSAANAAPTAVNLRRFSFISLLGATQARDVVLPVAKRTLFLKNFGTAEVTIKCGTKSIAVPAGQARTVRLTGATDGLEDISGGGSGGGSSGIPEAPTDGKQYARQNANWTEVVASSGGGGSVGGGYIPVGPATLEELATIVKSSDVTVERYADDRNFVVRRTDLGASSAERMGAAMMALPASGNWQVVSVIKSPRRNRYNYTRHGIAVRNSATDRWVTEVYGQQSNDPRIECFELGSTNVIQGGLGTTAFCDYIEFITFRIRLQGGNYTFSYSHDFGTTWNNIYTVAEANIPTGGRPDQVGIVNQTYNTFTLPNDTASPFFELTTL